MGMSAVRSPYAAKLGGQIRKLRMDRALSSGELAAAAAVTSSAVSKVEHGKMVPSRDVLGRMIAVLDLPHPEQDALFDLLGQAAADAASNRGYGKGLTLLGTMADRERTSAAVSVFSNSIIPRLLQTAEYARRILAMADPSADLGQAVAARMARQSILYDPGRTLEFVLTEQALRFRPGSGAVLPAQLDHLASVATLETVTLGVIPADADMHAIARCGFIVYEDRADGRPPFAFTETPHASLSASDPADVAVYRDQLAAFRRSAVCGTEAIDIIRAIARP
jgi:transcriptional regulator with XRE-family HTH domain